MKYKCKTCDYSTIDLYNFKKHINTTTKCKNPNIDINKCKIQYKEICEYCNNEYSNIKSLKFHQKKCNKIDENSVEYLKSVIENLKNEIIFKFFYLLII